MPFKVWAFLVSSELFRNSSHYLGTKTKKNSNPKNWGFSIILLPGPDAFWGILLIAWLWFLWNEWEDCIVWKPKAACSREPALFGV